MLKNKVALLFYSIIIIILIFSNHGQDVQAQEITEINGVSINDTFVYEYEGKMLEYKVLSLPDETNPGTVMVTGANDNMDLSGSIRIPALVTSLGVSYSVTMIGNNAFYQNNNITSIEIPNGVISIGDQAFQGTNIAFWVTMNSNAASFCKQNHYNYNYITESTTDQIAIDYITINHYIMQLNTDKKAVIGIAYYPNNATDKNVTWSSSNTAVAKVSLDGTVTAVGYGAATITAAVGTISARCTVLVSPDAPKSIKAICTGYDSIKLSWNRVRNAWGYRIYRASSLSGKYTRIADVKTFNYNDTKLTDATTYYYKVYAYGYDKSYFIKSAFSKVASARTKISITEGVFAISNYVNDNSIKLTWGYVKGAAGYMIYRASSADGSYRYVKSVSTPNYTDASLSKGKTYYYKIKAYNYVNKIKVISDSSIMLIDKTVLPKYVTFGTSEKNVYKILGSRLKQSYFAETRTYELYYKKSPNSFPIDTATIYMKQINGEMIVIGWSNLYPGINVSDGNDTNTGTFTLGSSMDEVNKVMETPKFFEYFYGATTLGGATARATYIEYQDGSTITFNDDMKVTGWSNKGCLKVKYGTVKPVNTQITLGISLSEVLKSLGTPRTLSSVEYITETPVYLQYGNTTLSFNYNLDLIGWKNKGKMNISIGNKATTTPKVKEGSTYNDVIKAMGTPDSYITDSSYLTTPLRSMIYGNTTINFDANRKVSGIQN